jgi:hypothetical protein
MCLLSATAAVAFKCGNNNKEDDNTFFSIFFLYSTQTNSEDPLERENNSIANIIEVKMSKSLIKIEIKR